MLSKGSNESLSLPYRKMSWYLAVWDKSKGTKFMCNFKEKMPISASKGLQKGKN